MNRDLSAPDTSDGVPAPTGRLVQIGEKATMEMLDEGHVPSDAFRRSADKAARAAGLSDADIATIRKDRSPSGFLRAADVLSGKAGFPAEAPASGRAHPVPDLDDLLDTAPILPPRIRRRG